METNYCIKTATISTPFESTTGVKQGCNLSPTLSNIFQNDMHQIFDERCSPVSVGQITCSSMSWADDLILFATSHEGVQRCLKKLNEYVDKMGLGINVTKSKYMILCKGKCKLQCLYIGGDQIEYVTRYKYLGFMISSNGNLNVAIDDRISKAKKAMFMLKQVLSTSHNVSTSLTMSLYDKQISPILLYGSLIWGMPASNTYIKIRVDSIEREIQKQVQCIIGLILGRNVDIEYVRGDRNRNEILVRLCSYDDKMELIRFNTGFPLT